VLLWLHISVSGERVYKSWPKQIYVYTRPNQFETRLSIRGWRKGVDRSQWGWWLLKYESLEGAKWGSL